MIRSDALETYHSELASIQDAGLWKKERVIESPQSARIRVNGKEVLNFCANNYLGLSDNKRLINAAVRGLEEYGLGLSSVRFICGTQTIHKELEERISTFLKKEDTILYPSCFDANGGLFETILTEKDAVISDALNHASIIDGVRLCKAKRFRYAHSDMNELETHLKTARAEGAHRILITTDGVFSMDGHVAKLPEICTLAETYGAMVHVDECHATGFFGPTGRGSIEHHDVMDRVDIVTSTLGKALGGAAGGFTSAKKEIIDLLRQRSRPYLFSNSIPPAIVAASIECIKMLSESSALCETLRENTHFFRSEMKNLGFTIKGEIHPIAPVMLGDARLASDLADDLLQEGVYVIGFSFPVVPKGEARIRTQISAAHTRSDLEHTVQAFAKCGRARKIIG